MFDRLQYSKRFSILNLTVSDQKLDGEGLGMSEAIFDDNSSSGSLVPLWEHDRTGHGDGEWETAGEKKIVSLLLPVFIIYNNIFYLQ